MFEALHATCRAMQSRLVELIDQVSFIEIGFFTETAGESPRRRFGLVHQTSVCVRQTKLTRRRSLEQSGRILESSQI